LPLLDSRKYEKNATDAYKKINSIKRRSIDFLYAASVFLSGMNASKRSLKKGILAANSANMTTSQLEKETFTKCYSLKKGIRTQESSQ